ncbi:unnamed protein product [Agarophyton chilense]
MAHSPLRAPDSESHSQRLVVESTTARDAARSKRENSTLAATVTKRTSTDARRRPKQHKESGCDGDRSNRQSDVKLSGARVHAANGTNGVAQLSAQVSMRAPPAAEPPPSSPPLSSQQKQQQQQQQQHQHQPPPTRAKNGVAPTASPRKGVHNKRGRDEDAPHCDGMLVASSVSLNELDDYRNECLKLEKKRHARVYEADKRRLYHENVILTMYEMEVDAILDEFEQARRAAMMKMLSENAEKMRQVEELRYGICKDDVVGGWQRKHEMALRGRGAIDDEVDDGRPARKKRTRSNSVKVNVELDDNQVSDDLAEMRGEKRQREEGNDRERRSKKRN